MTCPSRDRFEALLEGRLSAEDQSALSQHVEECAACQSVLETLRGSGHSWADVAPALAEPAAGSPVLEQVLQRAKAGGSGATTHADEAGPAEVWSFLQPSDNPDHLGRLDSYQVLALIGKGGMGIVFRGFDEKLHRMVAIKVMAPQLATSAVARKRFTREAQAAAAVSHDHVVPIYAVADDGPVPYLVMQLVSGQSLQEKLDRVGPLGLREILRIALQAAYGLAAAHAQGVVHRDIKPANILLENGVERVKITDFGLARAIDDSSVTQSGVVTGTPQYMAPEQAAGEAVDYRADLFSLGSVLYAMCTGRPPFRASGAMAVLKRVCEESPRPIKQISPDIPDWLCEIIAKLHAKKPEDRFQSAQEVAELLGQHLAQSQQPGQPARAISSRGMNEENPAGQPASGIKQETSRNALARLQTPAYGLTIAGILYWLSIPFLFFIRFKVFGDLPDEDWPFLWRGVGLVPAVAGFVLILAASKMRQGEFYWLSVIAACLPFGLLLEKLITLHWSKFVMTMGDWIALPFGMWALIVLTRRDVRAVFSQGSSAERKHSLPATPPIPSAPVAPPNWARRWYPLWLLLGVAGLTGAAWLTYPQLLPGNVDVRPEVAHEPFWIGAGVLLVLAAALWFLPRLVPGAYPTYPAFMVRTLSAAAGIGAVVLGLLGWPHYANYGTPHVTTEAFRHVPGAANAKIPGEVLLKRIDVVTEKPISMDGFTHAKENGWRFLQDHPQNEMVLRLDDVPNPDVIGQRLTVRARMRSDQNAKGAYLMLACHFADGMKLVSPKPNVRVEGATDWANYSATVFLPNWQKPERVQLYLILPPSPPQVQLPKSSTVGFTTYSISIKDIEFVKAPLVGPPQPILIRTFDPAKDKLLHGNAKVEDGGWRIEAGARAITSPKDAAIPERVRLFKVANFAVPKAGQFILRAKLKAQRAPLNSGPVGASLSMGAEPSKSAPSDGFRDVVSIDWATYETVYPVSKFQDVGATGIPLDLMVYGGAGTTWIKDVELLYLPESGPEKELPKVEKK